LNYFEIYKKYQKPEKILLNSRMKKIKTKNILKWIQVLVGIALIEHGLVSVLFGVLNDWNKGFHI